MPSDKSFLRVRWGIYWRPYPHGVKVATFCDSAFFNKISACIPLYPYNNILFASNYSSKTSHQSFCTSHHNHRRGDSYIHSLDVESRDITGYTGRCANIYSRTWILDRRLETSSTGIACSITWLSIQLVNSFG